MIFVKLKCRLMLLIQTFTKTSIKGRDNMSRIENISGTKLNNNYNYAPKQTKYSEPRYITKEDIDSFSKQLKKETKRIDDAFKPDNGLKTIVRQTKRMFKTIFKHFSHKA